MHELRLREKAKETIYFIERNAANIAESLVDVVLRYGHVKEPKAWIQAANHMGVLVFQCDSAMPQQSSAYIIPDAQAPGIFYCKDLPPEQLCRGFCYCLAVSSCNELDCTAQCAQCSVARRVEEILLP